MIQQISKSIVFSESTNILDYLKGSRLFQFFHRLRSRKLFIPKVSSSYHQK